MSNEEIKIITEIQHNDLSSSYDLITLNRSFLIGLYRKLHICGYYYEEFEQIAYIALIKAARKVDFQKLTYFNGYWKKYILHEYLQEKLRVQYQFTINIAEYQKCKNSGIDPIDIYYNSPFTEGLIIEDRFEDVYQAELRKILWYEIQNILDDKNAYIIWELFYNQRSMVSLAKELDIGAERIRRRKIRSLDKLKANSKIQAIARDYYSMKI